MSRNAVPHELATARLVLRAWRDGDREPFFDLNRDPRVMEHMPGLLTRDESNALIDRFEAHIENHGFGPWAVEETRSGEMIGYVGIFHTPFEAPFTPCVEVAWRLAFDAWGKGFATEAARASCAFGFDVLGLKEILAFTTPANTRSRRVMHRLGMTHDPADDFEHPRVPERHPLRRHVLYRLRPDQMSAGDR